MFLKDIDLWLCRSIEGLLGNKSQPNTVSSIGWMENKLHDGAYKGTP